MPAVQARTVRPGGIILHTDTKTPLRVVEPQNFGLPQGVPVLVNINSVFAVDDEGGLYAISPDQPVEVAFNVPLVTQPSSDHYVIVASFERQLSDDLPVMQRNFKECRITADPAENLPLAAMQQLALEMQVAYDGGIGGCYQSHRVILGRAFDAAAMGWKRRSCPPKRT